MKSAKVIGINNDRDRNPVGTYNSNLIFNTRVYDVVFPYGAIQKYSANFIAEILYIQVYEEFHRYKLMDDISKHHNDKIVVING